MQIEQKNLDNFRLKVNSEKELEIIQYNDILIIEEESIPKLLKFIKENYNL